MGIKRRFEIKKQQRWERRMERKKLAAKEKHLQPPSPGGTDQTPPTQPTGETGESSPTSTQTE